MSRKNPLTKSLYMMGAAVAILLLSTYVLKPQFQKEKENKDKSDLLWRNAKRDKIMEVVVSARPKTFALKRSAESKDWIVEADKSFDADVSSVDSLISSLLGTKKEDAVGIEPEKAGLDVPKIELKVVYTDEKDKSIEQNLFIGEDSPVDYQSYAKWKDQPEIFMISKSLKFALDKQASDFRNKKIFKYNLADFKEIKVQGKEPYRLELGEGGKWWLYKNDRKVAADTAVISDWISSLSNTRVSSFASDEKSSLGQYGLSKPALNVQFLDLKGGKNEWKVGHVKSTKENKAYVIHNASESVFEMPITFLDAIQKVPADFRNKRITTFDKSKFKKLSYTSKDLQIELSKEGEEWKASHSLKGTKIEGLANKALTEKILNSLSIIRAVSFVEKSPKSASLGLGKRKVQIFEEGATPVLTFEIGNKLKENDTVIWGESFEDPIVSLLNFDELFPTDASKLVTISSEGASKDVASTDKNPLDKSPPQGASSKTGKKVMKLEKTTPNVKEIKKLPAAIVEKGAKYYAMINFKNGKKLKVEFNSDKAPYTVSNFIHLARNGFYDGVTYHRVIPNFVAQGGDPTGSGRGGPGYMFDNEDNDLKHMRGSLSMAHAGRNTNGSQFFVVLAPQPHLDGLHTVFGQVTDGIDEIEKIQQGDVMSTVEIFQEK